MLHKNKLKIQTHVQYTQCKAFASNSECTYVLTLSPYSWQTRINQYIQSWVLIVSVYWDGSPWLHT